MGYLKIENVYRNTEIIDLFREVYAMEKIHGTSGHISFKTSPENLNGEIHFFPGGEKYENFVALFNKEELTEKFLKFGNHNLLEGITFFGEVYGGRQQGMSHTYGPKLKFIVFDVKIGDLWLNVPKAAKVASDMGLEFVHYTRGPATVEFINLERDADSVQAIRNGIGAGKKREGIVIRPIEEFKKNNGSRLIAKHKRADFSELSTPREIGADKIKCLSKAKEICREWCTPMRMTHVLDKLKANGVDVSILESTGKVIKAMIEDIKSESEGEINWSKEAEKEIGKATALYYKQNIMATSQIGKDADNSLLTR